MIIRSGAVVLVADGRRVRLLRNEGDAAQVAFAPLFEMSIDDPPTRNLGSDRPGRMQVAAGERHSAYADTDWHRRAEEDFARGVAGLLEAVLDESGAGDVVIVAPPQTLGEMRSHYGRATRERLVAEMAKDLTGEPLDRIAAIVGAIGE